MKSRKNLKYVYRVWLVPLVLVPLLSLNSIAHAGAIHDAARAGDLERVQKLVVQGADVNEKAVRDETALMLAALAGQGEIVNYLLQRGANIDARNASGMTTLHAAAYAGQTEIVSLLIAKGADVNDAANVYKVSPLHVASEENHLETVKLLLQKGADVSAVERHGFNAMTRAGFREQWEILELLLANGADCQPIDLVGDWLNQECNARAKAN